MRGERSGRCNRFGLVRGVQKNNFSSAGSGAHWGWVPLLYAGKSKTTLVCTSRSYANAGAALCGCGNCKNEGMVRGVINGLIFGSTVQDAYTQLVFEW